MNYYRDDPDEYDPELTPDYLPATEREAWRDAAELDNPPACPAPESQLATAIQAAAQWDHHNHAFRTSTWSPYCDECGGTRAGFQHS